MREFKLLTKCCLKRRLVTKFGSLFFRNRNSREYSATVLLCRFETVEKDRFMVGRNELSSETCFKDSIRHEVVFLRDKPLQCDAVEVGRCEELYRHRRSW
jgi:hypothetical protein